MFPKVCVQFTKRIQQFVKSVVPSPGIGAHQVGRDGDVKQNGICPGCGDAVRRPVKWNAARLGAAVPAILGQQYITYGKKKEGK